MPLYPTLDSSIPYYSRVPFSFVRQGDNPFTGRIINCFGPLKSSVDALVSHSRFKYTVLYGRVPFSLVRRGDSPGGQTIPVPLSIRVYYLEQPRSSVSGSDTALY